MKLERRIKTLFISGGLLIVLGLGNLIYGTYKLRQYSAVLQEAMKETARPDPLAQLPHFQGISNRAHEWALVSSPEHIRKFESRVSFYRLVQLGGKMFLMISGVLLLICLIAIRPTRSAEQVLKVQ